MRDLQQEEILSSIRKKTDLKSQNVFFVKQSLAVSDNFCKIQTVGPGEEDCAGAKVWVQLLRPVHQQPLPCQQFPHRGLNIIY